MSCPIKTKLITLMKRKWVTPITALSEANCLSLSQRCSELRRDGVNVIDKWVTLPSGKKVKAYRIVETAKAVCA